MTLLRNCCAKVTLFARDADFAPGVPTEVINWPEDFSHFPPDPQASLQTFFLEANLYLDLYLRLQRRGRDFDLLHVHFPRWAPLAYGLLVRDIPIIHTFHLPPQGLVNQALLRSHVRRHSVTFTTVSYACARLYATYAPIDAVIYNGVDLGALPFAASVSAQAPLLVAGRIAPSKGQEAAISIACANRRLR